jgi:hypothetical protein
MDLCEGRVVVRPLAVGVVVLRREVVSVSGIVDDVM